MLIKGSATSERDVLTVFGSINVDIAIPVDRLPGAGETVLGADPLVSPGGKGANQAHAGRCFGAKTQLLGCVGDDAFAAPAISTLRGASVDLAGIRVIPQVPTGIACISVDRHGENSIVVSPGANAHARADRIAEEALIRSAVLLLQMEVPLGESMALAKRAQALGCRVILNAAPMITTNFDTDAIDWLIVNRIELQQLCDALSLPEAGPADRADLLARHTVTDVALTLGAEGALIAGRDGRRLSCAALPVTAVDTTGAGDTFAGVLAAALVEGHTEGDALRYAVAAAGLACTRRGAQAAQPNRAYIDAVHCQLQH
jgi:ribokinase